MVSGKTYSEKALKQMYSSLQPVESLQGVYKADIPGPRILLPFKYLFLRLSGLPGWFGKDFKGEFALNMLQQKNRLVRGPKMLLAQKPHKTDQRTGLVATYHHDAPWLWRRCTDEFRHLSEDTILGVSYFNVPGFRNRPILFMLHKQEGHKGV